MKAGWPELFKANQRYWDELAPVHYRAYNLDRLRQGGITLDAIQLAELGNIQAKRILHLQCHIGHDSLSLARLGGEVTGVDLSPKSIETAKQLSAELDLPARFICCNVYDLPDHLDDRFDIVYSTQGVINWLPDLGSWADLIRRYLRPGGSVYLMDVHPAFYMLEENGAGELDIKYRYFHSPEPFIASDEADYADPSFVSRKASCEWFWPLGDILNALIGAGMTIDFLHEYDKLFYQATPSMVQDGEGWWVLPNYRDMLPLMFTLRASTS